MSQISRQRLLDELSTVAVRVFGVAAGLLTSAITARTLGPADRGEFFYIAATAAVLAQFGHFGTPGANTFFCAPDPGLARRLLRWTLALGLPAGLILSVGFLLADSVLSASPMLGIGVWLIPLTASILLLLMLGPLLAGLHAFGALNGLSMAYQVVLILAFAAVALLNPSTGAFLAASAAGAMLAVAAHVWAILRRAPAESAATLGARAWLAYGGRAYLILVLGALLPRLGLFAVKAESSAEELGYYSIAIQAFDALALVPASVATILFPTILRGGDRPGGAAAARCCGCSSSRPSSRRWRRSPCPSP
jgi:O-antigen/teichoic acid export membrane protein